MILRVFQGGKGDCLMLTGADGKKMLIDGNVGPAYKKHVAPVLGKMRDKGETIDVVYLSHIDDDHIGGILQMMNDEVAWRIHEFQIKTDNPKHKPPTAPRPPKMKAIWHNAFHDLVDDNTGEIEDMLAASAAILSGSENDAVKALAAAQGELVTSISQSIKLTQRVSPEQLGLKLNEPAKGKLMLVRAAKSAPIKLGGMRLSIIGPFSADLQKLREEWNAWLKANSKQLKTIRTQAKKDEASFSAQEIGDILQPKLDQAESLSELLPIGEDSVSLAAFKLGVRTKVTTPNLASLMLFVEEGKKTLLLTGDGHQDDILRGLEHLKKITKQKGLHVDVLKVQHHGSEHNIDEAFCRKITADHYIFCGNGEHENPDVRVVKAIMDSRLGAKEQLSPNPEVGRPFKLWFNSHSTVTEKAAAKKHMRKVEKLVEQTVAKSKGKLSGTFLKSGSFVDIKI